MTVETDAWQLDVCVAGPQKCLGGLPGMSLISVSPQAWAIIENNPAAPRASFLSLLDWREQRHGDGHFPCTLHPGGRHHRRRRAADRADLGVPAGHLGAGLVQRGRRGGEHGRLIGG